MPILRDQPQKLIAKRPFAPGDDLRSGRAIGALTSVAVVLVALNLRPVLAAIGPVLDRIEASSGFTSTSAGLLTTLPILLMGLGALLAAPLRRWIGERRGVAAGITILAIACVVRPFWSDAPGLLASAAVAGIGIAAVQALMPSFIKRRFSERAGRMMGLYSTGIMGGAALAAASAAGLTRLLGWEAMLGLWALPALLALILWQSATRSEVLASPVSDEPDVERLWLSGKAWLLLLFFGVGTSAYTLVLAWLPPYYVGLGRSEDMAGFLLAGLTLMEVVAGLAVSATIERFPDRRGPLAIALLAILFGLIFLIAAPLSLALPAMVLLGLGIGALFPLSLIVTLDHADDPARAGSLAAFVQGGGYIIASAMPFLAGWMRSQSNDLSQAWVLMAGGVLFLFLIVSQLTPGRRIILAGSGQSL